MESEIVDIIECRSTPMTINKKKLVLFILAGVKVDSRNMGCVVIRQVK